MVHFTLLRFGLSICLNDERWHEGAVSFVFQNWYVRWACGFVNRLKTGHREVNRNDVHHNNIIILLNLVISSLCVSYWISTRRSLSLTHTHLVCLDLGSKSQKITIHKTTYQTHLSRTQALCINHKSPSSLFPLYFLSLLPYPSSPSSMMIIDHPSKNLSFIHPLARVDHV